MTTQPSTEVLVLYTVEPDHLAKGYAEGSYRNVIGLEVAQKELWISAVPCDTRREEYEVPEYLAHNAMAYVERHYVGENAQSLYRNRHLGAAAITGAGYLKGYEASDLANRIISRGEETADLQVGQWGAIGNEIGAFHSMTGIAPGLGLQTDSERGPFSVVSHASNLEHYRVNYGADMRLFALHSGNPGY